MYGLIDADSIVYQCSRDSLKESLDLLHSRIYDIKTYTQRVFDLSHIFLFLSKPPYFRQTDTYKKNRRPTVLKYTKTLTSILYEEYHAYCLKGVEADDLLSYYKFQNPTETILIAIDKDVLNQIPGTHFNYLERIWDIHDTTEQEAYKFLWLQMLMGDSSDGISGIPKIGVVKANKILKSLQEELYSYEVLAQYNKYYGLSRGIKEFYKTFKQVYLLKTGEDFLQAIGEKPLNLTELCSI